MKRFKLALMSVLVAGTAWAQSNITLVADADTSIEESSPTDDNASLRLQVRSYTPSPGRQNSAYIRFDLNVLADVPETNAVFSVSRDSVGGSKLQTFSAGQVHVYGLLDTGGNTPQAWSEGLNYNSTGLEWPGDADATTQDLDTNRVVFIGDLPASIAPAEGEIFSISNAALQTFISDRYAADGLMTLMLVEEDGANKELYFIHSETSTTNLVPSLFVVGDLGGVVIDTNPPTVALSSPTNGATSVDVNSDVLVQFSEPLNEATINTNTFVLYDALSNSVTSTFVYNPGTLTATLYPHGWLTGNSTYTAVVKGGSGGVADTNANEMVTDYIFSFTTGDTPVIDPNTPYTLDVDADTYLTNDEGGGGGPNDAHGTETRLQIRWHPVRVRMGYVRYEISGVPSSMFADATLSGTFERNDRNNSGTWNVYGVDDAAAGAYWNESTVTYATAAGVVATNAINTFGITNATLLGTIELDGFDNTNSASTFVSNPTNLPLASFLEADTDGVVTFIIMTATADEAERYVDSKEGLNTGGHGPMKLSFPAVTSPPTATTINYILPGSGSVTLGWDTLTDHGYSVERTPSLQPASWTLLSTNVVTNSYIDAAPSDPNGFYRVIDEGVSP